MIAPMKAMLLPSSTCRYLLSTLPRMSRPPDEALALNIIAWPTLIIRMQLSASSVMSPVSEGLFGNSTSKMYRKTGIKMEV